MMAVRKVTAPTQIKPFHQPAPSAMNTSAATICTMRSVLPMLHFIHAQRMTKIYNRGSLR